MLAPLHPQGVCAAVPKASTAHQNRLTMPAPMNIPSLQERKEFWSWGYANCAFEEVVEGCNFLFNAPKPIPYAPRKLLIAGIVATYARPFTASHGAHTIPKTRKLRKMLPMCSGC